MGSSSRILETANHELEDIVSYLASHGKHTAEAFINEYAKQLDLICSGTVSYGLSRMPELALLGYRTALVGSYGILYYFENDFVVVAHIFHQSQDYAALVASSPQNPDEPN